MGEKLEVITIIFSLVGAIVLIKATQLIHRFFFRRKVQDALFYLLFTATFYEVYFDLNDDGEIMFKIDKKHESAVERLIRLSEVINKRSTKDLRYREFLKEKFQMWNEEAPKFKAELQDQIKDIFEKNAKNKQE